MIQAFYVLILGALAGWVAGFLMNYPNRNLLNTIIIGVSGSILGYYLFDFIGFEPKKLLGTFLMALFGSCAVLWLLRLIKTRF
jgi:uncharacterized membrane protein YeaQ/YmgE (transglycosylase-associated protein family)